MKTKVKAKSCKPATRTPAARRRPQPRRTRSGTRAAAAPGPHYDTTAQYDSGLRYAVTDPVDPVNNGGKAELDLNTRMDDNLLQFALDHIADMAGNPNFTTPLPSTVDFQAIVDDYALRLTNSNIAKSASKLATDQKQNARAILEEAFNLRWNYVQLTSNSNTAIILSSGLPLQASRSPLGDLPPPLALRVDLNGVAGTAYVSWGLVTGSVGYLLCYCKTTTGPALGEWLQQRCNKAKTTLEGLTVGETYILQVAAAGGASAQSSWSPEVLRTIG